jgi:RHS repeat-associated protein
MRITGSRGLEPTQKEHSGRVTFGVLLLAAVSGAGVLTFMVEGESSGPYDRSQLSQYPVLAPGEAPHLGTFWSLQRTNFPPLPFNPLPELPVYWLDTNTFMLMDLDVDYIALAEQKQLERALRRLEAQYGITSLDSVDMSMLDTLGEEDYGVMTMNPAYQYEPGSFYLEITGVTSNANLIAHGTSSEQMYSILSGTDLTNTSSRIENVFQGKAGQDWTELAIAVEDRTNSLFFRGRMWSTNDQGPTGLSISLTNPVDGTVYPATTNITLKASAHSTNATLLGVAFYAGDQLLGVKTNAPYELVWTNEVRGWYALRARAFDSAGAVKWSSPVNVGVDPCYPAVDVVLAIDCSYSMTELFEGASNKLQAAKMAATNFVRHITLGASHAGVVSFWGDTAVNCTLSSNQPTVEAAIAAIAVNYGTRIDFGITNAYHVVRGVGTNAQALPVIVLLSDGSNEPPETQNQIALRADEVKSNGVRLITIAIGTNADTTTLQAAASPPGNYYYATNASQLDQAYASIVHSLCISNAAPSVSITAPTNNALFTYGTLLQLQATASDSDGAVGAVTFLNNGAEIGTAIWTGGSTWTFFWERAPLGTNVLTARATDDTGQSTTSSNVTIQVYHPPPTVQITNLIAGQTFVFSPTNIVVAATASATDGWITDVEFLAGSNSIGHATNAPYSVVWTNVAWASNYTVKAIATDDWGATATNQVSIVVNAMPMVLITGPTNLQKFREVTNVVLSASASDPDGAITNVQFYTGTSSPPVLLGTVPPSETNYTLTWNSRVAAFYPITAVATDNRGARSPSQIRIFEVLPTNTPPVVEIIYPTTNQVFRPGANITLIATATNFPASVTNVEFFANGRLLGSDAANPYSLTECCWKPGNYQLLAKAEDNSGSWSVSTMVNITITNQPPTASEGFWNPAFQFPGTFSPQWQGGDYDQRINALKVAGPDLYVGGGFYWFDPFGSAVLKWNGTNWISLGQPYMISVRAIEVQGTNLYIAGQTTTGNYSSVMRWNGADSNSSLGEGWEEVGNFISHEDVRTMCFVGSDLYIGGDFASQVNPDLRYVARLNPSTSQWEPVGDGLSGPVYATASFNGRLFVGGLFTNSGASSNVNFVAELQGDHWVGLGAGIGGTNALQETVGVFALTPCGTNLFVGGNFDSAGGNTNANGIAIWDTCNWSVIGRGLASNPNCDEWNDLVTKRVVNSIATRGNSIFVAGQFRGPEGAAFPAYQIAQATWDENLQAWLWSALDLGVYRYREGSIPIGGDVMSLAIMEGASLSAYDMFVGGEFQAIGLGQKPANYAAQWRVGYPSPQQPSVTITNPVNLAIFTNAPAHSLTIPVTALASSNISYVELYVDGKHSGTSSGDPNGSYPFVWPDASWSDPTNGVHALKAVATDGDGLKGESQPVLFTVKATNNIVLARDDVFSIPENGPVTTLLVLTNDAPADGSLRIKEATQPNGNLARVSLGHNGSYLLYTPLAHLFGTDRFYYTITNSSGASDSAWVTVNLRANPRIQIETPATGARFRTNTSISITGISGDYDGAVTNVTLRINGVKAGQTTNTSFSFNWSTNAAGFYLLDAVATDNEAFTNVSSPVAIVVTNAVPSSNRPIAIISNLTSTVSSPGGMEVLTPEMIRDGLFNLQGRAADLDAGDSVSYQVLLFRPEDYDTALTEEVSELIYIAEPYANATPVPLNFQRFHIGGDTNGALGTIDLTAVPNGVYDLVLRVRGGTDETNAIVRVQLESNLKIGQFTFSEQDLGIPVNGIPLTVVRTYNSLNTRSADFGYGWTYTLFGMDVQLDEERHEVTIGTDEAPWADEEEDENGLPKTLSIRTGGSWDVTLTLPDGRRTTFAFNPRVEGLNAYARWTPPADVHATLSTLGYDLITYFPWVHWAEGGANSQFLNHDVPGWLLETQDGTKYQIERGPLNNLVWDETREGHYIDVQAYGAPRLTKILQRSGDALEITAAGIFHHPTNSSTYTTRSVWFERDQQNRIVAIRDPNSGSNGLPVLRYVYHQQNGNLLQVLKLVDRSAGTYATNKYHYDHARFPHYITSVENPLGTPLARNEFDDSGRLTAVVDAAGTRTQFIHNFSNSLELIVDPIGRTNTFVYDPRGNVTATTNALAGVTLMAYDDWNNKTNEVVFLNGQPYATNRFQFDTNGFPMATYNALGYTNLFTYGPRGQLLTSTDARGSTSANFYDDATDSLLGTRDALGNCTTNFYNSLGLLIASRDALGTATTNFYDSLGNLIGTVVYGSSAATNAILSTNTFAYDANGNRTNSTTWRRVGALWTNASTTYVFDAMNRMVQTIDPDGGTNTVAFDAAGRQQQTRGKLGHATSYVYDYQGRLISTGFPNSTTNTTAYDATGNRTNSVDQAGRQTTYRFDALNRMTNTVYADGASTRTVFDDLGRVRFSVDARITTNAFGYDVLGRRVAVTNALGTSVQTTNAFRFDANGNQIVAIDGLGRSLTNVFDALNRLIQVQFPDGTKVSTAYDAGGRKTWETNQDNIVTRFAYDGAGRLIAVTNGFSAGDATTWAQYQYDEAGNQIAQIDALGRTTSYAFDGLGRRIKRTLPGQQSENLGYDLAGNLAWVTNFNGVVITNQYDSLNRLTNRTSASGYFVRFAYTLTGQRASMSDLSGSTAYSYDNRDRLLVKAITWAGGPTNSLSYRWDANGNLTNLWSSTSGGVTNFYQFDAQNRLTNVLANGSAAASYEFDGVGNLQTLRYGNGVTNRFQYDLLNRLTNVVWKTNAGTIASFYYRLGLTGNRTNVAEVLNGTGRTNGWVYDSLYRLKQEIFTGATTGTLSYAYDLVGNRTSRTNSGNLSLTNQSFTFNTNDWLATDGYDSNGNTTTNSGGQLCRYDPLNHLTNYNNGAVVIVYDGDGNRVKKTVGSTTTYYLLDDRNPSGYVQVLEEWTGPTNLSRVYNYGLQLISQRQPNTSTNYFVFDGHGSTRVLTDKAGKVVNAFTFDAYGTLIASNTTAQTTYLYCGEQFDSDLGTYHLRARYYNPQIGRFWTMDSYDGSQLKPSSLHKYLYCNADPIDGIDPTGLRTFLVLYGEDSTDVFERSAKWYQERIKTFEAFVPGRDDIAVEKVYTVSRMAEVLRDYKEIQYIVYIGHGGWGVLYLGQPSGKNYNLSEFGGRADEASESSPIKVLPKENIRSDARIDLISCYSKVSAPGGRSIAQAFADYFNVPVQGAGAGVSFWKNGKPRIWLMGVKGIGTKGAFYGVIQNVFYQDGGGSWGMVSPIGGF